jgi:hypothetical protein
MSASFRSTDGAPAVLSSDAKPEEQVNAHRIPVLKRALLAGATAFITVNVWTGGPLFALWVGSRVSSSRILSMAAVGVVVVVLAVLELVMVLALAWLNNIYDELSGRPLAEPRATWLRSMRAEPEGHVSQRVGITTLERIIMVNVWLAVIALAVWWVFFSGSPLVYA